MKTFESDWFGGFILWDVFTVIGYPRLISYFFIVCLVFDYLQFRLCYRICQLSLENLQILDYNSWYMQTLLFSSYCILLETNGSTLFNAESTRIGY